MIVYNVNRSFFALKAEANTLRKELGLKEDDIFKLQIDSREQLATFLTELCTPDSTDPIEAAAIAPSYVYDRAEPDEDKDIPLFLRKSRARLDGKPEPKE